MVRNSMTSTFKRLVISGFFVSIVMLNYAFAQDLNSQAAALSAQIAQDNAAYRASLAQLSGSAASADGQTCTRGEDCPDDKPSSVSDVVDSPSTDNSTITDGSTSVDVQANDKNRNQLKCIIVGGTTGVGLAVAYILWNKP